MSSIGELRRQVESEPDGHVVRWRLAKKLYADSDYREALLHLRILKNEWDRKLNVIRYLAAAYYRLGRYDEAIDELKDCIDTWPDEISIREQLAKVYSAAGRDSESMQAWEAIREIDPGNRMARKALDRLNQPRSGTPYPVTVPSESDDGLDLRPVVVCGECGAQNSAEFERCWQCGSGLNEKSTPAPAKAIKPMPVVDSDEIIASPRMWQLGTTVVLALLAISVFVSIRQVPPALGDPMSVDPPRTVAEVLLRELTSARLTLWVALAFVCPVVITLVAKGAKIGSIGARQSLGLGIGFASAIYLGSWLPVQYLAITAMVTALLLMPAVVLFTGAGVVRGVMLWVMLLIAGAGTSSAVYFAFIGAAPFEQAAEITYFAGRHDAKADPGIYPSQMLEAPAQFEITWAPTGSPWLDTLTGDVAITLSSEPVEPPVRLELYQGERLVEFVELTQFESRMRTRVQAGVTYRAILRGQGGVEAEMHIAGVLTPTVTMRE